VGDLRPRLGRPLKAIAGLGGHGMRQINNLMQYRQAR
jgi:hypothetical protein